MFEGFNTTDLSASLGLDGQCWYTGGKFCKYYTSWIGAITHAERVFNAGDVALVNIKHHAADGTVTENTYDMGFVEDLGDDKIGVSLYLNYEYVGTIYEATANDGNIGVFGDGDIWSDYKVSDSTDDYYNITIARLDSVADNNSGGDVSDGTTSNGTTDAGTDTDADEVEEPSVGMGGDSEIEESADPFDISNFDVKYTAADYEHSHGRLYRLCIDYYDKKIYIDTARTKMATADDVLYMLEHGSVICVTGGYGGSYMGNKRASIYNITHVVKTDGQYWNACNGYNTYAVDQTNSNTDVLVGYILPPDELTERPNPATDYDSVCNPTSLVQYDVTSQGMYGMMYNNTDIKEQVITPVAMDMTFNGALYVKYAGAIANGVIERWNHQYINNYSNASALGKGYYSSSTSRSFNHDGVQPYKYSDDTCAAVLMHSGEWRYATLGYDADGMAMLYDERDESYICTIGTNYMTAFIPGVFRFYLFSNRAEMNKHKAFYAAYRTANHRPRDEVNATAYIDCVIKHNIAEGYYYAPHMDITKSHIRLREIEGGPFLIILADDVVNSRYLTVPTYWEGENIGRYIWIYYDEPNS